MLSLRIKGVLGSRTSDYFDLCLEHFDEFEKLDAKLQQQIARTWPTLTRSAWIKPMWRHWETSVIFGQTTLEAFIFDYVVRGLSKTYFETYLDKLSLKAKWVVIPRLVTGVKFPTGGEAFRQFAALTDERNDLIHPKSYPEPEGKGERLRKELEILKKRQANRKLKPPHVVVELLRELRNLEDARGLKSTWWELADENRPNS